MRHAASFAAAVTIAMLTCAPAAAQPSASLIGSWSGEAPITVSWTDRRYLEMQLDIDEFGGVTGRIGDARLVDARIHAESRVARAMHVGRAYALEGRLSGALMREERVTREWVHLSLDLSDDVLVGDLETSGSYDGSPSDLRLTAKGMVLHRAEPLLARTTRPVTPPTPARSGAERAPTPR